jgi:hypothetical protein
MLVAADFGSAISGWTAALVPLRAVGGIGTGLTVSACYYMCSLENQQRNAAACTLAQSALALVVITLIPKLAHSLGWRSVFIGLGLLVIPCLLLARDFSAGYEESEAQDLQGSAAAPPVILWLGLISSAMFNVAIAVFWTYIDRIGAATGIAEESISTGLSIATAMGFLGSVLVIVFDDRINGPIVFASVILNIIGIVASSSAVAWIYVAAISAYYATLPIYFSAQFSVVMRRASSSQFAAKFTLSTYVGSLGPALGGLAVTQFGILAVRWLAVVFMAVSAALLWIVISRPGALLPRAGDGMDPQKKRDAMVS